MSPGARVAVGVRRFVLWSKAAPVGWFAIEEGVGVKYGYVRLLCSRGVWRLAPECRS